MTVPPQFLPKDTNLATMGVQAFYTNIPHVDRLQTVKNTTRPGKYGYQTVELCGHIIYLSFGNDKSLQNNDTGMSTSPARNAPLFTTWDKQSNPCTKE